MLNPFSSTEGRLIVLQTPSSIPRNDKTFESIGYEPLANFAAAEQCQQALEKRTMQ